MTYLFCMRFATFLYFHVYHNVNHQFYLLYYLNQRKNHTHVVYQIANNR